MELSTIFFTFGISAFIASAIVGFIFVEDKYDWIGALTPEYTFCHVITPIIATLLILLGLVGG